MTPQKQIKYWKKKLRVLKSWRLYFAPKAEYTGQTHINNKKKTATIYDLPSWWDKRGKIKLGMPKDYIFHELLHISIREVKSKRSYWNEKNAEETLVQDICKIVNEADGFKND